MKFKAQLMDEGSVKRALMRISHEILEKNKGADDICIVGIRRRGEEIAKRIAQNIKQIEGVELPLRPRHHFTGMISPAFPTRLS